MRADVYKKFGTSCLENYGLCSSHYLSAPALIWGAMLGMAKVELNLISEVDMYFFKKKRNMRDGVSYISKRYSKASNKCWIYDLMILEHASYDPMILLHTCITH